MKRPQCNIVGTSFGTILKEVNPTNGQFKVNEDTTVFIDTLLQDVRGTKKTFLKDSIVEGSLWTEINKEKNKQRKVVVVEGENGRYLISKEALTPTTKSEINAESKLDKLGGKVEELLVSAKQEVKSIASGSNDFLEKKYAGFTGKQILVGALGVIVIVKIFK